MRKLYPVLMILLLLLALGACKEKTERRADGILAYYTALERYSWSGTLRVDYGDRVLDFGLNSAVSGGTTQMEVTSPDMLRGVKARLGADTATLEYDGMILETGKLPGTGLSPLEIIPFIQKQWAGGYVVHESRETVWGKECARLTFTLGNLEMAAWFGPDNEPVLCELMADGVMTARLTVAQFAAERSQ